MVSLTVFKKIIWDYYDSHRRDMPWRKDITPYKILISEVMLQQTQVSRTEAKFKEFIEVFPDLKSLASAELPNLLGVWQGMGYNRRALYLKQIAQIVTEKYKGKLPDDPVVLDSFPGLGPATAASIIVYAFNKPLAFIETNVRRIYLHHFFADKIDVPDSEILPLVKKTVDTHNPRDWYYALMDYGTMLAKTVNNPNKRSRHYSVQSKFEGSDRQIRGGILRLILKNGPLSTQELYNFFNQEEGRVEKVIGQLRDEGFIVMDENKLRIK